MAKLVPINREISQAFKDWTERRAFVRTHRRGPDSQIWIERNRVAVYRVWTGQGKSRPAPWSKAVRAWFGADVEAFTRAARTWAETNGLAAWPPRPQLRIVRRTPEGMFLLALD
jgi:hypothetical protein